MLIIYFLIAISATTIGSLTGMGGGVIIKPLLDFMGDFDAATISLLSSISVFSMSIVSIVKQILNKATFQMSIVIPLAVGAIVGGNVGQILLDSIIASSETPNFISIIQNVILCIMLIVVFFYMLNKDKIKSLELKSFLSSLITGFALGFISAFLGIGGGPMNVAAFIYLFSYDTKTAALSSLITIFFSQISKLCLIGFTTGFSIYDLSVAPFMVIGAVSGGFIGSKLIFRFTEKQIDKTFNYTQAFIILICIINIALLII